MDILEKLFGSSARVKIMRLFLFNTDEVYDIDEVVSRVRVSKINTRKELVVLEKIGMLRKVSFTKDVEQKRGKKVKTVKKKVTGYEINSNFIYLSALQNLLINMMPLNTNHILKKLSTMGRMKLILVSGVFIQEWENTRVDILIVGDKLKIPAIELLVRTLEAEIGKEIRYAIFETHDFQYRVGVCDKLVRDILEYPHQKLIDKIDIEIPRERSTME
ncbi:hypothetical protein COB55_02855 [Candidatus Wolfebacteria bacterium]|nr:MAG: hypothetical protein COB55_02855 [Candidatus Wolfebacteria bacterium]